MSFIVCIKFAKTKELTYFPKNVKENLQSLPDLLCYVVTATLKYPISSRMMSLLCIAH